MPTLDSRIDSYIERAPAFAQPILKEIRARIHEAFPNVEESIKWNAPFFLKEGRLLASMAAFKQHAKFGLWGIKGANRPEFVDLDSVDALPPRIDFVQRIQTAVAGLGDVARRAISKAVPGKVATAKPPRAGTSATAKPRTAARDSGAAKPKVAAKRTATAKPKVAATRRATAKPEVTAKKASAGKSTGTAKKAAKVTTRTAPKKIPSAKPKAGTKAATAAATKKTSSAKRTSARTAAAAK